MPRITPITGTESPLSEEKCDWKRNIMTRLASSRKRRILVSEMTDARKYHREI